MLMEVEAIFSEVEVDVDAVLGDVVALVEVWVAITEEVAFRLVEGAALANAIAVARTVMK